MVTTPAAARNTAYESLAHDNEVMPDAMGTTRAPRVDQRPSATYERTLEDQANLLLYADYERFRPEGDAAFYWLKDERALSLSTIRRIETQELLGAGFPLTEDPRLYFELARPPIEVVDCGIGCPTKVYSEDESLDATKLKAIWEGHFSCEKEWSPERAREQEALKEKFRLRVRSNPFCVD